MDPVLAPPLKPMPATLARELPLGPYLYEPKWDGFRCRAFRSGAGVDLRSRHGRLDALLAAPPELVQVTDATRVLAGRAAVASLLLGLYDADGRLVHVGVAGSFNDRDRLQLAHALRPLFSDLRGHPWEKGFGLEGRPMGRLKGAVGVWTPELSMDWVPVRPELVCEVGYDQLDEIRFRHPATFLRWRPERTPESCTFDQFAR